MRGMFHMQIMKTKILKMHQKMSPVTVLGPGKRAAIWVQGCLNSCQGCISPDARDMNGGEIETIDDIARWICNRDGIEGITISGGEPMLQAEALVELIREVKRSSDLGIVCYTGFIYENLLRKGKVVQKLLLQNVDMLIDGPYISEQHADLLWRGSSNQRLIPLSDRYREHLDRLTPDKDKTVGMQFYINDDGAPGYFGVPPIPSFDEKFISEMEKRGISVRKEKEARQ